MKIIILKTLPQGQKTIERNLSPKPYMLKNHEYPKSWASKTPISTISKIFEGIEYQLNHEYVATIRWRGKLCYHIYVYSKYGVQSKCVPRSRPLRPLASYGLTLHPDYSFPCQQWRNRGKKPTKSLPVGTTSQRGKHIHR